MLKNPGKWFTIFALEVAINTLPTCGCSREVTRARAR